jgi:hypothetical protein
VHVDVPKQVIRPIVVPVLAFLLAAALIIAIGETLLNLFDADFSSELARKELWFGTLLALAILAVGSLIVLRNPSERNGVLDREVVVGRKPMFAEPVSPLEARMRAGGKGFISDITEGYTLYARNGEFARVMGMIPGGSEAGRTFKGYIYAEGMRGANRELWIPIEAVLDVYPETHSAFLAIMGDETEAFGWNKPPLSFNRGTVVRELPKTL